MIKLEGIRELLTPEAQLDVALAQIPVANLVIQNLADQLAHDEQQWNIINVAREHNAQLEDQVTELRHDLEVEHEHADDLHKALCDLRGQLTRARGGLYLEEEHAALINTLTDHPLWQALLGKETAREVDDLLDEGHKIEAIKQVCKITGFGLRLSKVLVDKRDEPF